MRIEFASTVSTYLDASALSVRIHFDSRSSIFPFSEIESFASGETRREISHAIGAANRVKRLVGVATATGVTEDRKCAGKGRRLRARVGKGRRLEEIVNWGRRLRARVGKGHRLGDIVRNGRRMRASVRKGRRLGEIVI